MQILRATDSSFSVHKIGHVIDGARVSAWFSADGQLLDCEYFPRHQPDSPRGIPSAWRHVRDAISRIGKAWAQKKRPLTLAQAKAQYPHRYTVEHVPAWARKAANNGKYYAPQCATDAEWYDNTLFHGESELASRNHCYSSQPSWPMGQWLDAPLEVTK